VPGGETCLTPNYAVTRAMDLNLDRSAGHGFRSSGYTLRLVLPAGPGAVLPVTLAISAQAEATSEKAPTPTAATTAAP
jgi:hypothetical protein